MSEAEIGKQLIEIVEPVVTAAGYELVDLQYRREQNGWVLRVFIDAPGGISFDDCERVSRELGPVLDVRDPVPQAYNLEVSSPGVARPLRTPEHFRRYAGQTAKVTLGAGINGRRNFKGTLVEVEGDDHVVIDVDGESYKLPVGDIRSASLVPDWNAVGKS